jgi:hypothetical protein
MTTPADSNRTRVQPPTGPGEQKSLSRLRVGSPSESNEPSQRRGRDNRVPQLLSGAMPLNRPHPVPILAALLVPLKKFLGAHRH